jgi:hypothetical protein
VPEVKRNAKLALAALTGAVVGAVVTRFKRPAEAPSAPPDDRAEELRRKLAEARAAAADEDDFEAAGMGAETIVEEPPRTEPEPPEPAAVDAEPAPEPPPPEAKAPEAKPPEAKPPEAKPPAPEPPTAPAAGEPPPQDEFEAMRRRIHEEGRAAADEMKRSPDKPDQP